MDDCFTDCRKKHGYAHGYSNKNMKRHATIYFQSLTGAEVGTLTSTKINQPNAIIPIVLKSLTVYFSL